MFHPAPLAIDALLAVARSRVPGIGSTAAVHRAVRVNPDAFWAIARRRDDQALEPEGFLAVLLLNADGRAALESGTLDVGDPPAHYLSRQDEQPSAIYVWLQFAPGKLSAGMPLVLEKFSTTLYRDTDIYTRAATQDGDRFMRQVGFRPDPGFAAEDLYVFRRGGGCTGERPIFDRYSPGAPPDTVAVTIARTLDDLLKAAVIRGAVFVAEQACPFAEEFDGNDTSGHQLLGYVGDEPAGCLRVRYFAGFAKLERLAVRQEFRDRRLGVELIKSGIALCQTKGYGRIYGQSQLHALAFYQRLGFRERLRNAAIAFSDHFYREIVLDVAPAEDAVTLDSDPYVIIRPEGRWDLPGALDRSAARPVAEVTGR